MKQVRNLESGTTVVREGRSRAAGFTLDALAVMLVFLLAGAAITARADQSLSVDGAFGSAQPEDREWRFRVFLDQKEIGFHNFYLEQQGDTRVLRTIADFEYKLLFVKLYEYQHENHEVWQGNCLASIESSTDANGKPFAVLGQRQPDTFIVQGHTGEAILPSCIMSFAYWNPVFLQQQQLLNSQDGKYLDVVVSPPEWEQLKVQGQMRSTYRYHLVAGKLKLDLWYSEEREWLGLQSETEGGRMLRYELL